MKSLLLIPFALVAGAAIACPADGSRDAAAAVERQPMAAVKAAPEATKAVAKVATAKPASKAADKVAIEQRKVARL